jgi:hypothetical protein
MPTGYRKPPRNKQERTLRGFASDLGISISRLAVVMGKAPQHVYGDWCAGRCGIGHPYGLRMARLFAIRAKEAAAGITIEKSRIHDETFDWEAYWASVED